MIDRRRPSDGPIVIVNSGAYVEQELLAEFGALPPALLPIGLGRLYERQAEMLRPLASELVLTLPESFELSDWDAGRLDALGFQVLRTPDALGLGSALLFTLGVLGFCERRLRILHGDTLMEGLDLHRDDVMAVADAGDGYRWGKVSTGPGERITAVMRPGEPAGDCQRKVLCGYFAFGSATDFAESLAVAQGDFYAALKHQVTHRSHGAVTPGEWLDFGHVQTFFRSRRIVTTARAFNSLEIHERHVRKRSRTATAKLQAEARWLREVPATVAPFCVRLLGEGEDSQGYFYDSEYEYMPTLSELYVFGRVTPTLWTRIMASCASFIDASIGAGRSAAADGQLTGLVITKTAERLHSFAADAGLDMDAPNTLNGRGAPSLRRCLSDIADALAGCGSVPSVMHGDFCFSNILYNSRTDRIRLIDPRGITEGGEFTLFGDVRYDLAKLMHSICGRYDLILAGLYDGGRVGPNAFELRFPLEPWRVQVEETARAQSMGGVRLGSRVVWAAMTSLFLSMPPLHQDRPDRQGAFIANALRLHAGLERAA